MHFVSGGLLKQEKSPESTTPKVDSKSSEDKPEVSSDEVKSDKKEKRDKKAKKEKKEKKDKKEKKEKKEKSKDKKKKKRDRSSSDEETEQDSSSKSRPVSRSESPVTKAETSETDRENDDEDQSIIKRKSKSKKRKRKDEATEPTPVVKSGSSGDKPSKDGSVVKTREQIPLARQVIRSRYIQQKKRALMDTKSLNEVCSLKYDLLTGLQPLC